MAFNFKKMKKIIFNKYNSRCAYCGKKLTYNNFHIEHITPKSLGGLYEPDNLLPACVQCNLTKRTMDLEQFRSHIINMPKKLAETPKHKILFLFYNVKPNKNCFKFYFERFKNG